SRAPRVLSHAKSEIRMTVEVSEVVCQCGRIVGIAEDKAVHTLGDNLRAAIVDASYDGEAASHGLQRRQGEGILSARADVSVCSSIETYRIHGSHFPTALLPQAQALRGFEED